MIAQIVTGSTALSACRSTIFSFVQEKSTSWLLPLASSTDTMSSRRMRLRGNSNRPWQVSRETNDHQPTGFWDRSSWTGISGGAAPRHADRRGRGDRCGQNSTRVALGRRRLGRRGRRGVICDVTSRGDSQNHAAYARGFSAGNPRLPVSTCTRDLERAWDFSRPIGDYFHPIDRAGRRVTRADLDDDQWHEWKSDLARSSAAPSVSSINISPADPAGGFRRARAGRAIQ